MYKRKTSAQKRIELSYLEVIKMKYGIQAKAMAFAFNKMLRDYYRKHFPEQNFKQIKKDVTREYKAILLRTPDIGGSSLESNLVGAAYFFAAAKVIPHMTPKLMDAMIAEEIGSDFMKKINAGKKKKAVIFSDKAHNQKLREAEASHNSNYEMDWEFTYKKGKDEFWLTYTKCGVCRLAQKENVTEYLPCMCKMDYPKYQLIGATLERSKTLAAGDDCCNFHVIREK